MSLCLLLRICLGFSLFSKEFEQLDSVDVVKCALKVYEIEGGFMLALFLLTLNEF